MSSTDFSPGDLVWAKMKGYSPWPGKVVKPPPEVKILSKPKKPQHYIFFFGSNNNAWIFDENISHHSDEMLPDNTKKKSAQFSAAVDIIINESKKQSKKEKHPVASLKSSSESSPSSKTKAMHVNDEHKKKKDKVQLPNNNSTEKKSRPKTEVPKKTAKKRSNEEMEDDDELPVSFPNEAMSDDDQYSALLASVPPNMPFKNETAYDSVYHQSPIHTESPPYVERRPSPDLDLRSICDILASKRDRPTDKKIGFLGLGSMGRGIVKNLLSSGHEVCIWNRTPEKCDDFIKAGANRGSTPADVVSVSDITFCCVSDPEAAKSIVFGIAGVLEGLEAGGVGKGFVEMTSVDPDTSQEIAEAVARKGATYLEAFMNGSKKTAEDGILFILVAGNRHLFTECSTCFKAISKHAYYIGCTVGTGSQMNLIFSMLYGVMYASLGEAMALVDRLKLSQNDFMEILELSSLMCSAFHEKGHAILHKDFNNSNTKLTHVQRDIRMAISLGDQCNQPTPMASASNEVYKHAKLLKYSDHDVCAVYQGSKY